MIRQENAEEDNDLETDANFQVKWRPEDGQLRASLDEKSMQINLTDMQLLNPNLKNYSFDKKGKWCEIELEVSQFSRNCAKYSTLSEWTKS